MPPFLARSGSSLREAPPGGAPSFFCRRILNDRIDVTEARIIGARHDARYRCGRAFTLIDSDVELLGGEIALVLRPEIPCVHALELPIEREAKLRDLLSGRTRRRQCKSQRQCSKAARQRH